MANIPSDSPNQPTSADFRSLREGLDMEEHNLRAQLDTISKRRELLDADESRHLATSEEAADKERRLEERRVEQQKRFQELASEHTIASLHQAATTDLSFYAALRLINQGQANTRDYNTLKLLLVEGLIGDDKDLLKSLATRVLAGPNCQLLTTNAEQDVSGVPTTSDTREKAPIDSTPATEDLNQCGSGGNGEGCGEEDAQTVPVNVTTPTAPGPASAEGDKSIIDQHPEFGIKVKREDSNEPTQPASKRRALTQIENRNTPTQLTFTVDVPARESGTPLATPVKDINTITVATPGTQVMPSTPVSRGRDSVTTSDTGVKRTRNDVSADSKASTTTPLKKAKTKTDTPKRTSAAFKRFEEYLRSSTDNDADVAEDLNCQKCGNNPTDPRISSCAHLYCNKCIMGIRSTAKMTGGTPGCMVCKADVSKQASKITSEQVDEWKKTFGGEEDGGGGDDDDDEDSADEEDA